MDPLEQLEAELNKDENILAAVAEHEEACQNSEEDTCVICNVKNALSSLMFVDDTLRENTCDCENCQEESFDELDIAVALVTDLESGLRTISVCQMAIKLLSGISNASAFLIAQNELEHDPDCEHGQEEEEDE